MQLDQRLHVASLLVPGVQEVPGLPETEVDVVPTTAPLPVPVGHAQIVVQHFRPALLRPVLGLLQVPRVLVAGTLHEVAHGARPRDRVGHAGRRDGVHETRLPSICNRNQSLLSTRDHHRQPQSVVTGDLDWLAKSESCWEKNLTMLCNCPVGNFSHRSNSLRVEHG